MPSKLTRDQYLDLRKRLNAGEYRHDPDAEIEVFQELDAYDTEQGGKVRGKPYIPKQRTVAELPPRWSGGAGVLPPSFQQSPYSPEELQAANRGVNIDRPTNISTIQAAMAKTGELKNAALTQAIKAKYGPDTLVQDVNGQLEWYDKDVDQWNLVKDSLGGKIIGAAPTTGEIAGAVAGSFIPGKNLGAAAPLIYGSLGAGAGNTVGRAISGKDITPRSVLGAVAVEGLASGALYGIPKGVKTAFRGKELLSPEQAKQVLKSYADNLGAVKKVNQALGGYKQPPLQLSTGQVAASATAGRVDPQAAAFQAHLPLLHANPEIQAREIARREADKNAIEFYWQNELVNPTAYSNITHENWQASLKLSLDNYKQGKLGPYQKAADDALNRANQQLQQLPTPRQLNETEAGQIVRSTIKQAQEASDTQVSTAWAEYQKAAKYRPSTFGSELSVPLTGGLAKQVRNLKKRSELMPLTKHRGQAEAYIPEVGDDNIMDLAAMDQTIKKLRKENSLAARGDTELDVGSVERNVLLRGLTKARDKFLKQYPDAEKALAAAEAETVRHKNEFSRGFVSDFIVNDGNYGYKIADPALLETIVKNKDKMGAEELAELIRGEPNADAAIKQYILASYRNKVVTMLPDGSEVLSPAKHARWVQYELPYLESFLDKAAKAQIRKVGGAADVAFGAAKKAMDAEKEWKLGLGGVLERRLNSETFVSTFFDSKKELANRAHAFIKRRLDTGTGDSMERTKAGIVSELNKRVRDNSGRLNINALEKIYTPLKDRFRLYFGDAYVGALDDLIKVGKMAADEGSQRSIPLQAPEGLMATAQRVTYGPPMSPTGRGITGLRAARARAKLQKIEAAMYDPKELVRLANKADLNVRRAQMAIGGTSIVLMPFEFDDE